MKRIVCRRIAYTNENYGELRGDHKITNGDFRIKCEIMNGDLRGIHIYTNGDLRYNL